MYNHPKQSTTRSYQFMGKPFFMAIFSLFLSLPSSLSLSTIHSLGQGSSLSPEKAVLISPNGVFSSGFYTVGENAYCFAIWFTEAIRDVNQNHTIVWMANRDKPVNGRRSKLSLLKNGNLILTDAGQFSVWETSTQSASSLQLLLFDNGNLVLRSSQSHLILWKSFDSPTHTLLPDQPLTRNTKLVSCRSQTNYSSGFYKLFFDDDNVLRLLFDGKGLTSVYWPNPWLNNWASKRSAYNNSKIAAFNSSGHFKSTDDLEFSAADFGLGIQRRLTMDVDGNLRMYSLDERRKTWKVSWQAFQAPCKIHGICGPNALCAYVPQEKSGRKCSCLPGYRIKNHTDLSLGCVPDFSPISCNDSEVTGFLQLDHVEFFGYDFEFIQNYTLEMCEKDCLQRCDCYGFQYKFDHDRGYYNCYPKSQLLNGYLSPGFGDSIYLKLPKALLSSSAKLIQEFQSLDCSQSSLDTPNKKPKQNGTLRFMLWFATGLGGIEIICIILVWCFLHRTRDSRTNTHSDYLQVATGFRKFTYDDLKRATRNFGEEIGRGGGGIVYKGVLTNGRVAAIKKLNEANRGEAEFLAEESTIGRINHMNLIEIWGYCAEGKHRLLVYEYMECGSLAENLPSGVLNWEKRFDIAVGSAKGLAYLHEECLEWVLHCDVKPQNILLDSNYHPKVADFGLSKFLNRGGGHNSSFSKVRGTRGYMAPEWILNLPITSKVDVYSYGVVVLEMVTGKSPMMISGFENSDRKMEQEGLVKWVRKMKNEKAVGRRWWVEGIVDPVMKDDCDLRKMEMLVEVALQCVEEDRAARPTMSQVAESLETLLQHQG